MNAAGFGAILFMAVLALIYFIAVLIDAHRNEIRRRRDWPELKHLKDK